MLRVSLAASGAEIAVLDAEKLDEMPHCRSVVGLKRYLSHQVGCSRFRQRILNGSPVELGDDQEICPPVDLQLVILDFWPSEVLEDAKLISACEHNEVHTVEEMLHRPQNPDTRDRDGWPALHFAAQAGNASCMELLLESLADLEIRATEDGSTALHCAAFHGHPEVVELLLAAGAERNSKMEQEITVLHHAAAQGNLEIVRLLLDAGAEKNSASTHGNTPLHRACYYGHSDLVAVRCWFREEQCNSRWFHTFAFCLRPGPFRSSALVALDWCGYRHQEFIWAHIFAPRRTGWTCRISPLVAHCWR